MNVRMYVRRKKKRRLLIELEMCILNRCMKVWAHEIMNELVWDFAWVDVKKGEDEDEDKNLKTGNEG